MPLLSQRATADMVSRGSHVILEAEELARGLMKRVKIPINSTSSPALVAAVKQDPFSQAGKYGLGWFYFCIILLLVTGAIRCYHWWGDKIRRALFKEEIINSANIISPESEYELPSAMTDNSTRYFFPAKGPLPEKYKSQATISSFAPLNNAIAVFRWIFYRTIPVLKIGKLKIVFPSLAVVVIVTIAFVFCVLYCFVPQPLYYQSMSYGSPPLAIRAGMLSVAMMPWIVALSSKANFITIVTGIGHERLNVLHRWAGYLSLFLALVHAVPFWVQSARDAGGFAIFKLYFSQQYYIFSTGIAALVPLIFLCVHSLPYVRAKMYEVFVTLHTPVSLIFIGMMFWHCSNYLTSWNYLIATLVLLLTAYLFRLFFLNWSNPLKLSWLIGEESAVTLLPENAVKVTIPTQKKWRPGQYVYLRMPGISLSENHPFTIASLCSDDFPSEYGEIYRDMTLVFRPFGGFTRKLYNSALEKGPYKTYRAFIDGPYGGMHREMASFDQVVFFAGGSGITAIASQLLDLIKRMRDGRAVTHSVRVVWALKRPETMEWFKEELRICREYAPPDSVHCSFYITASKRNDPEIPATKSRPHSTIINDKVNAALQGVASKRNSALNMPSPERRDSDGHKSDSRENDDTITALPQAHLSPPQPTFDQDRNGSTNIWSAGHHTTINAHNPIDFGFPNTPSKFQKSLMRFAFLPTTRQDGWRTEYGRPDIPFMLRDFSRDFGRRTCVFVCGPPSMRIDVTNTVAKLQSDVWSDPRKDEIFLHAENYAI